MGATIGRRHSDWVYGLAVNEDINEGKSLNKYQLQVFHRRFRRDPKSPAAAAAVFDSGGGCRSEIRYVGRDGGIAVCEAE